MTKFQGKKIGEKKLHRFKVEIWGFCTRFPENTRFPYLRVTKIAKSRTVRQRVYLSHPGVPGGHTWWLESSGALLARGGSILAKSLFLAVVLHVFTGKSNGKAKMAKN